MPGIRVRITTQSLSWSRRKLDLMKRDIRLMLAREGAPNCIWEEFPESAEFPTAPPSPDPLIHLFCKGCPDTKWYAATFTACPSCGQRDNVRKATVRRVVPPKGALVVAA